MNWPYQNIPKIVHLYWGNEFTHLPYLRFLTLFSIRKYNPDWRIILHMPKIPSKDQVTWKTGEQDKALVRGKNFLQDLSDLFVEIIEHDFSDYEFFNDAHEVHKSDFLRWHLLNKYGGVWSDMDVLYFKSFNNLKFDEGNLELNTGVHIYPDLKLHAIGLLLSNAGNPLFNFCEHYAKKNYNLGLYQSIGSDILNKYFPNLASISKEFPNLIADNITESAVYSISSTKIQELYKSNGNINFKEDSIGCHWYGGHSLSRMFENICLDKDSILPNCILSNLVQSL